MWSDYEQAVNAARAAKLKVRYGRFEHGQWVMFIADGALPVQSTLERRLNDAGATLRGFGVTCNEGGHVDFVLKEVK